MGAVMGAMALTLLRDHRALVTTFVLPSVLFLFFAFMCSISVGQDQRLRVAAARITSAPAAETLLSTLASAPDMTLTRLSGTDAAARVEDWVKEGRADVGLIVRDDPSVATAAPPLLILTDPEQPVAAALLMARVQNLLTAALPGMNLSRAAAQMQILLGPFSAEQTQRLKEVIANAPELMAAGGSELMARRFIRPPQARRGVTYYAGAVTTLFLLIAASQGAFSLVAERCTGLFDRLLMARGGVGTLVAGKFAFLVLQGLALAAVLFAVAQLVHGVDVIGHFPAWLLISLASAAAAAGVALALAAACRTRRQMLVGSTLMVLLFSAVGGALVPRFLMPRWLQYAGELTPTAWAIDAYRDALGRGAPLEALAPALAMLLAFGACGGLLTFWLLRRAARMA